MIYCLVKCLLYTKKILLSANNITIRVYDSFFFNHTSWRLHEGEQWVILGTNGAGKSTLMHMITGDNQQSHANKITLFGKRKGQEISMWEIKKHIGIVSTDLMLKYDSNIKAYDIILSGFFDSLGLYKKVTKSQKEKADFWIKNCILKNS